MYVYSREIGIINFMYKSFETKSTKKHIFFSHKLLSFWNICRWSPSPIGPTQMTPLDMNLKFIFSVGTITALWAIEGFFSSMCWNMSFHVATFCHDFWAIRTGILSWPNNLWFILQQQREKKNFYFSKKKKRNFNTKNFQKKITFFLSKYGIIYSKFYTSSRWLFLKWSLQTSCLLNLLSQMLHANGFTPVCFRMWT